MNRATAATIGCRKEPGSEGGGYGNQDGSRITRHGADPLVLPRSRDDSKCQAEWIRRSD